MDFTIYTVGSAEFLELILNGAAMITGTGGAEDLARIGALLGMLLLAMQATFNNQAIGFQKAGLMLVLYMAFYGPTVTAVIEDTVSNQVRVVDNVPLGPVAVGSILSTISYEITRLGEQAVSTPEMTQYGLFSSLTTMAKIRDALRNPDSLDAFNNHKKSLNWDFPRSVREYLALCTLNPVMLRTDKTLAQLYRAAGMAQIMSAGGHSQFIQFYDGATPSLKSCAEASTIIKNEMNVVIEDVFFEILTKGFASEYKSGRINNEAELQAQHQSAIDNMGLAGKSAQEFVLTSIIEPVFNTSRVDALNHWQENLTAVALRDSLNQQQIQWAGKGDNFKHYMRPMIAFFEGMLYAMTPFMAFALMLGSPGLKVLGKYLVLPLAVGLWMPLLSIVNAFTLWYASAEIEAIGMGYDATGTGFAMVQLMDIDQAISKALGIGGLLAASVPPLALFIVSGSAMVANGIMGQMTAADKFRSEDVNPRASNGQAPVLASEARYTSDQTTQGVSVTGMRKLAEKYSLSDVAKSSVKSAEAAAESSGVQLAETLRAGTQNLTSSTTGRQALQQMGETIGSSSVLSNNSEFATAVQQLKESGMSEQLANQVVAAAAIDATASAGAGGGGGSAGGDAGMLDRLLSSAKAGVSGSLKTSANDSTAVGKSVTSGSSTSDAALSRLVKSLQSVDKRDLAFAASDAYLKSDQAVSSTSNAQEVSKARTAAIESRRAYETAVAFEKGTTAGQEIGTVEMAAEGLRRGGARQDFVDEILRKDEGLFRSYQQQLSKPTLQALSQNEDERHMIAGFRALAENGRFHEVLNSRWNPFDISHGEYDAYRNQDLEGKAQGASVSRGELESKLGGNLQASQQAFAGETDMFHSGKEDQGRNASEIISGNTARNNEGVLLNSSSNNEKIYDADRSQALNSVVKRGEAVRLQGGSGGLLDGYIPGGLETASSKAGRTADLMQTATLSPNQVDAAIEKHREFGIDAGLTPAQAQYRALVKMGYGPEDERVQSASMSVQAEATAISAAAGPEYADYGRGVIQSLYDGAAGKGATNSDLPALRQIAKSREAITSEAVEKSSGSEASGSNRERRPTSID